MATSSPPSSEALASAANRNAQSDLESGPLSRAPKASPSDDLQAQIASALGGGGAAAARGFQSLALAQSAGASAQNQGLDQLVPEGMPVPRMSDEYPPEYVAVSGNTSNPMGSMSSAEFRERIQEFRDQRGGFAGGGGPGGGGGGVGGVWTRGGGTAGGWRKTGGGSGWGFRGGSTRPPKRPGGEWPTRGTGPASSAPSRPSASGAWSPRSCRTAAPRSRRCSGCCRGRPSSLTAPPRPRSRPGWWTPARPRTRAGPRATAPGARCRPRR